MRLLIIGANGTIGQIITPALAARHEVITAGRNSGDIKVDISSSSAVIALFKQVGNIDACICIAGDSIGGSLNSLTDEKLYYGLQQKLLGQVHLVLHGQEFLNDHGSFTLISGKMGDKPVVNATGKAIANGAVNSFVLAASLEMERGIRLNVVSPAKIDSISKEEIIDCYLDCIEGKRNGSIIKIGY